MDALRPFPAFPLTLEYLKVIGKSPFILVYLKVHAILC